MGWSSERRMKICPQGSKEEKEEIYYAFSRNGPGTKHKRRGAVTIVMLQMVRPHSHNSFPCISVAIPF